MFTSETNNQYPLKDPNPIIPKKTKVVKYPNPEKTNLPLKKRS